MNAFFISWKNIKKNRLSSSLSILLIAFGVALLSILLQFNKQFTEQFEKNQAGIDLVVGAKGSPLQLILNSMFHVDAPTGNIKIEDAAFLFNPKNPFIKASIPLSIGDSYKTFRIVGTTTTFVEWYDASIKEGRFWAKALEVVVGHAVAQELNLHIGDTFFSSHGFNEGDLAHDEGAPFRVVGILDQSGTVADKIILTSTESIWKVHESHHHDANNITAHKDDHDHHDHHSGHDHDHEYEHEIKEGAYAQSSNTTHNDSISALSEIEALLGQPEKDITSVLVKFHSDKKRAIPVINMPRNINENTPIMATAPSYELNKLLANVASVLKALSYLAIIIAVVSALSMFISLFTKLKERQYELALMRVSGGSPLLLSIYIITEALIIGFIGFVIGLFLAHIALLFLSAMLNSQFHYSLDAFRFYKEEYFLGIGTLVISLIAALIPAIKAYHTDIIKSLQ